MLQAEYKFVINLGDLGTCVMEDIDSVETEEGFTVVMDGYTSEGIRVHMVLAYPKILKNAVLFKMEK